MITAVYNLCGDDGWVYFRSLTMTLDGFADAAEQAGEMEQVAPLREESKQLKAARGQRVGN